ncbi:MAG: hypothetical protein RR404_04410 [Bacilli bacterium]
MKRRIYTKDEIDLLKKNIFIKQIKYNRELEYDPIFKLWTIMMRLECPELTAQEIFEKAGINILILHPELPRKRINYWFKCYKKFGIDYFLPEDKHYSITDDFKNKLLNCILEKLN